MTELVKTIAQALVDHPDQVYVEEFEEGPTTVIELEVDQEDLGQVIGKAGRTARAIRTVLGVAAARAGRRYVLEILD